MLLYEDYNDSYPYEHIDTLRDTLSHVKKYGDIERIYSTLKLPKELKDVFKVLAEHTVPPLERLVKESLSIVGASLVSLYDEGHGRYKVEYEYHGIRDSVIINDQLFTLDAGICLSGRDTDFDLSSIVLVKSRRTWDDDY